MASLQRVRFEDDKMFIAVAPHREFCNHHPVVFTEERNRFVRASTSNRATITLLCFALSGLAACSATNEHPPGASPFEGPGSTPLYMEQANPKDGLPTASVENVWPTPVPSELRDVQQSEEPLATPETAVVLSPSSPRARKITSPSPAYGMINNSALSDNRPDVKFIPPSSAPSKDVTGNLAAPGSTTSVTVGSQQSSVPPGQQ